MKSLVGIYKQDGSALIYSMLILLLLTIAGITALNTTNIEISTSKNSLIYKQSQYAAEAVSTEGSRWLRNLANDEGSLPSQTFTGLEKITHDRSAKDELQIELADFRNSVNWTSPAAEDANTVAGTYDNTSYRIMDFGIADGESLVLNNTTGGVKHEFVINGRYNVDSGARKADVTIENALRIRVK
ncbi:hypothetical protein [uncultured Desulfuromonas sp.]|uniref:hypothetical protein n=1 Tax=uncultured Desulfuromonas sp. TaxID=181013 RepID=UPI002AAC31F3|nr:hypothetical protein [uncultured Desulfuromonas sp.]